MRPKPPPASTSLALLLQQQNRSNHHPSQLAVRRKNHSNRTHKDKKSQKGRSFRVPKKTTFPVPTKKNVTATYRNRPVAPMAPIQNDAIAAGKLPILTPIQESSPQPSPPKMQSFQACSEPLEEERPPPIIETFQACVEPLETEVEVPRKASSLLDRQSGMIFFHVVLIPASRRRPRGHQSEEDEKQQQLSATGFLQLSFGRQKDTVTPTITNSQKVDDQEPMANLTKEEQEVESDPESCNYDDMYMPGDGGSYDLTEARPEDGGEKGDGAALRATEYLYSSSSSTEDSGGANSSDDDMSLYTTNDS